jgi:hypothetical protein
MNDGALDNSSRLGAVADLAFVLQAHGEGRDFDAVVVVAGDTLFEKSVDVAALLEQFLRGDDVRICCLFFIFVFVCFARTC